MANSYTIQEIREAAERARTGRATAQDAADPELQALPAELAGGQDTLYRIGEADLDTYLLQRDEYPCDRRMPAFRDAARHYIDQCEGFGEHLGVCLDLAYGDTADVACTCPAHDQDEDQEDGE